MVYIAVISFFLLIYKKLDFSYASWICKRFYSGIVDIGKITKFRSFVQENRVVKDSGIFKYVSIVPAFMYNKAVKKLKDNYVISN